MSSDTVNATRMRTSRRMLGMSRESLSTVTAGRASVGAIAKLDRGDSIEDNGTALFSLVAALQVPCEFLLSQPREGGTGTARRGYYCLHHPHGGVRSTVQRGRPERTEL